MVRAAGRLVIRGRNVRVKNTLATVYFIHRFAHSSVANRPRLLRSSNEYQGILVPWCRTFLSSEFSAAVFHDDRMKMAVFVCIRISALSGGLPLSSLRHIAFLPVYERSLAA